VKKALTHPGKDLAVFKGDIAGKKVTVLIHQALLSEREAFRAGRNLLHGKV
jgi:hypothetical protein